MPKPIAARMTNQTPPDGTTLFLIGMRVTKPWRLRAWLTVFLAMPRMLVHMRKHPETGMLDARLCVGASLMVVSYWRSAEDVRRFAANPDAPHLAVWRKFNKRYADTNSVGTWHETYVIGAHETIAGGMPPWGLSAAVGSRPVGNRTATAAQRMAGSTRPAA